MCPRSNPRSPKLTARREAETRSRECAVRATAGMDRVPPDRDDFWSDLRRGRRRIYGGLLAFIDRAAAIGAPYAVVDFGIRVVHAYARDVYNVEAAPLGTPLPQGA